MCRMGCESDMKEEREREKENKGFGGGNEEWKWKWWFVKGEEKRIESGKERYI